MEGPSGRAAETRDGTDIFEQIRFYYRGISRPGTDGRFASRSFRPFKRQLHYLLAPPE